LPYYITCWFPFTIDEVTIAFEAMGVEKEQARRDAELMASEMTESTKRNGGFGMTEIDGFLDPIARLSADAERRVTAYRQGLTFDRNWDPQGGNGA
jgi:hypothetical protein